MGGGGGQDNCLLQYHFCFWPGPGPGFSHGIISAFHNEVQDGAGAGTEESSAAQDYRSFPPASFLLFVMKYTRRFTRSAYRSSVEEQLSRQQFLTMVTVGSDMTG